MEVQAAPVVFILIKWVVVLVFGGLLAYYLVLLGRSFVANWWLKTEGQLVNVDIIVNEGDDERITTYTPIVKYKYTVNGATFHSENLGFGVWTSPRWLSERTIRNACAHPLSVFYNPINPGQSVLVRGFTLHHLVCLLFVGLMFAFSVVAAIDV